MPANPHPKSICSTRIAVDAMLAGGSYGRSRGMWTALTYCGEFAAVYGMISLGFESVAIAWRVWRWPGYHRNRAI
jgi:hypothetical protein